MKNLDNFTNQIKLAVDSSYGKYMFEVLKDNWGKPENFEELKENWFATNTENENIEWYYDAQTNILDNAVYKIDGKKYNLCMNEDLWFVPVNVDVPDEWLI